jgi:hypothetical protein
LLGKALCGFLRPLILYKACRDCLAVCTASQDQTSVLAATEKQSRIIAVSSFSKIISLLRYFLLFRLLGQFVVGVSFRLQFYLEVINLQDTPRLLTN